MVLKAAKGWMRTLATGNGWRLPRQRGFTLLELMVVLVIMALSFALVALTVPGASSGGRELGQRLQIAARLAQSEALAQGTIIALQLERNGYRFLRYEQHNDSPWQAFDEPELLRGETFAEDSGWQWALTLREPLPVTEQPRLYFWPDGTLSPFTLQLIDRQRETAVLWTLSGSLLQLDWQTGAGRGAG